jgi:ComF family protein
LAADEIGGNEGHYIKLLLLTGKRRGALAAMRWEEIDLAAGRWTIPAEKSKNDEPLKLILPVPLHPRRLRQRGFNQAVILGREISRRHGVAMDLRTLRRIVDTEAQAGLKKDERRSNIRKAFSIAVPERIRGQSILLVDDVYTTGSTLGECAETLLKAGAEAVGALTLARAIQEPS